MNGAEGRVAVAFALSIVAGLAVTVVYALGGQPQVEGALLAVALGGLGAGLILWGKRLIGEGELTEERERGPSPAAERDAAEGAIARGQEEIGRRRFLSRLLFGALGALGLAALFPIRSLGPSPGRTLFRTRWTPGARLVNEDGVPVTAADLQVGSVITVFPEGHVGAADSQTLLIRVEPALLRLPPERLEEAPDGHVAYSKVCTHAGCPVGLYQAQTHLLLCPCHQSSFDVLEGAAPVFGPAARPLPQLPVEIDGDGFLRARSDFPEPVGPGYWDRPGD
ncbi:MAG: ubiquinol-cytochrome c reductase iron-sulfur subunit [Actinomycetota bacterium]